MSGPAFFQTLMGRKFYEGTMPELVRQLMRLNDNIEKLIEKDEPRECPNCAEGQVVTTCVKCGSYL